MNLIGRLRCFSKINPADCLLELLLEMRKHNQISSSQQNMMTMMLKLSNIQVRDVMVPRANMISIHINDSQTAIANKINEARHSRYPVTTDNKDEIIGILLAKNLINKIEDHDTLKWCIEPFFVPESKRLDILLKEFQKNHTHMAIVKDEYNGVAGLITLEDVIEEILGEIEDEDYNSQEKLTIKQISEYVFLVAGHMTLEEVNQATGAKFESNSIDTIGGYIAQSLGYFPKPKVVFEIDGVKFKIEHADAKHIRSIKITLPKTEV